MTIKCYYVNAKNRSNENQLNCLKYLATTKLQIKYINTNQPSSCCWIENMSVGDVCMYAYAYRYKLSKYISILVQLIISIKVMYAY